MARQAISWCGSKGGRVMMACHRFIFRERRLEQSIAEERSGGSERGGGLMTSMHLLKPPTITHRR